ncbi:hypothetical protein BO221_06700 [Archangium sp. Cb G35]|uniref:AAA family ATPase n=1 Tax=Archangium sp. Cb G35 TaxID=1920190 RepID=UPI000936FD15|nr:AAA-like domain-containing protein [Archangium sp. Cb G35]OJT25556.1 hypothetical protein BO221_06700 [Archangium sp. Cb G35]
MTTVLYLVAVSIVLFRAHRLNPMRVAQRFFSNAGFTRAERISRNLLSLSSEHKERRAYALLWQEERTFVPLKSPSTIYVLYADHVPEGARDQLRNKLSCDVILLSTPTLAIALSEGTSASVLREAEDRFATRVDPYDEAKPVDDPAWFHGRVDLLDRLAMALKQGQHVGLFGLRKVGKTSLLKQLRNRAQDTPVVEIDCQSYEPVAIDYLQRILAKLRMELERLRLQELPPPRKVSSARDFHESVLELHQHWVRSGRASPFFVLLDEIDKFFVDRRRENSARILAEYVQLLRPLRALAQESNCLSVLVTTYRAEVNRQNVLMPSVGENPMFMSFQEYFLGALSAAETRAMVEKIGAWRDIRWEPAALEELHAYCGGHPFLTRILASDACEGGRSRWVTLDKVRDVTRAIQSNFPKHRIGQYYKESIWQELREDEREALLLIASQESGLQETALPDPLKEALTQIELYGLIRRNEGGMLMIAARLLSQWVNQEEYE